MMVMNSRPDLEYAFLKSAGWEDARCVPLAGDASARRYQRLFRQNGAGSAVLMDVPAQNGETTSAFVGIARYLLQSGFSAPEIISEDRLNGFLLLEDFGDDLFARILPEAIASEELLYNAAVDVLVRLHNIPLPSGIMPFTAKSMADQAGLIYDYYAVSDSGKAAFCAELETLFNRVLIGSPVLILRDYHAENLIWLPDRNGVRRVGLLDFQDAVAGPVGYDLVSLLYDARRDVPQELAVKMIGRFADAIGLDKVAFNTCCAALTAQRNLRILAVFARLSRLHGKTGYVDLIPRVWGHLINAQKHPDLADLAKLIRRDLPAPTPEHLNHLRSPCQTPCP